MNPLNTVKNKFLDNLNKQSKTSSSFGISKPPATPIGSQQQYDPSKNMSVAPVTNPSATNPTPTVIKASTSPSNTPKDQFISNLSAPTQNAYDTVTGARTDYGKSQGLPDMLGGKPVKNTPTSPTAPTAPAPKADPYQTYLQSLFDPKQAKIAQDNVTALNERTSSELLRTRAREDELRKNEAGQLERGQNYQLGEEQRLSNRSLADLAIAKGASVDTLTQIMNAGKEAYTASQPIEVGGVLYQKGTDGSYTPLTGTGASAEGFTLGKDQVRYDAQGNVIAGNQGGGSAGGSYVAGADPTADAWVKYVQNGGKITDVPNEYQSIVAQGTTTQPKPTSEIGNQVVTTINDLINSPAFDSIFGPVDQFLGGTLGPQAILAKNKYNQLKGLLSLDNIKYLKGTGAISDAEQRLLANAASAIGRNLYSNQAREELIKLRDGLANIKEETSTSSGGGGLYDF